MGYKVRNLLGNERGVDYSWSRPDPAYLAAQGFTFTIRYVSTRKPTGTGKELGIVERNALHAAGLGVLLVWETSATRPTAGMLAGSADGMLAAQRARDLDYPETVPLFVAVDTAVTTSNRAQITAYLQAFQLACQPYAMGVYGGTTAIDLVPNVCGWQANASSWSPRPSPNVHLKQRTQINDAQGSYDPNIVVRPFPAWFGYEADKPTPPDPEVQPPLPQGDDMSATLILLTDANAAFIGETDAKGIALTVRWTGSGADPKVAARIDALKAAGCKVQTNAIADLINCDLDGPLPSGDSRHVWTGDEFANDHEIKSSYGKQLAEIATATAANVRAIAITDARVTAVVDALHAVQA